MDVRDQVYCFEIARRAVGRAAIHLGIETMTEESLNVMADVLLAYMNRLGRTMSHLVESSGRTSAHVNILDAFQAVEVVAAPAVQRLHLMESGDNNQEGVIGQEHLFGSSAAVAVAATAGAAGGPSATVTGKGPGGTTAPGGTPTAKATSGSAGGLDGLTNPGWQGLAAFCFGPNWRDKKDDDVEYLDANSSSGTGGTDGVPGEGGGGPGGGKRGPSAMVAAEDDGTGVGGASNNDQGKINKDGGWEAPYLDEVPHFPQAARWRCANSHPLPAHVALSLHNYVGLSTEEEDYQRQPLAAMAKDDNTKSRTQQLVDVADQDLSSIPDGIFSWGSLMTEQQRQAKRKLGNISEAGNAGAGEDPSAMDITSTTTSSSPPSKKMKLDDGSSDPSKAGAADKGSAGDASSNKKSPSGKKDAKGGASKATGDIKNNPKNKKKKAGAAGASSASGDGADVTGDEFTPEPKKSHSLPYVPYFYPPAPITTLSSKGRTVVDTSSADAAAGGVNDPKAMSDAAKVGTGGSPANMLEETDVTSNQNTSTDIAHDVRSSLVQLGHYWGSGWEAQESSLASRDATDSAVAIASAKDLTVQVPLGRIDGGGQQQQTSSTIVPLGRASGSRVSRILEGSMDAAAMQ